MRFDNVFDELTRWTEWMGDVIESFSPGDCFP